MPHKVDTAKFLENQLRYFIAAKGRREAGPATKLRAMMLLGMLKGLWSYQPEDKSADNRSPEVVPNEMDAKVQSMLDQIKGGFNADQLSKGSS